MKDYYTVPECQALLGRSRNQVYIYSREHKWRGLKIGSARLFLREDVDQVKRLLDAK